MNSSHYFSRGPSLQIPFLHSVTILSPTEKMHRVIQMSLWRNAQNVTHSIFDKMYAFLLLWKKVSPKLCTKFSKKCPNQISNNCFRTTIIEQLFSNNHFRTTVSNNCFRTTVFDQLFSNNCFRTTIFEHLFSNNCSRTTVFEHLFSNICFRTTAFEQLFSNNSWDILNRRQPLK
jgi:hypothetical protein